MVKRIAISGASGNIAYSLLFRIAQGELFGGRSKIALHLLEVPEMIKSLEGVVMELEDCAFPQLAEIKISSDPLETFKDVDVALLIGAKPRGPGMERKDLLQENAKIFVGQGRALNEVANKDCIVLVVGNPCNTNCWIARSCAPRLKRKNFFAMTRLDQNRAMGLLAKRAKTSVDQISHMAIWGNHSSTQVPDFTHAKIGGKSALEVIKDKNWLETTFIQQVQQRGAEVIAARGKSSAASAASAIIDSIQALTGFQKVQDWFSVAKDSEKNPYGIDEDLIFSYPCLLSKEGNVEIVKGLEWDAFLKSKVQLTEKELVEELDNVRGLCGH